MLIRFCLVDKARAHNLVKGKLEEWQLEVHVRVYLQERDADGSGAQ